MIHAGKTPVRVHFIPEWAERRGKKQAHFAKDLSIDKSTVSRWFDGVIPTPDNLERIAAYLQLDDERALFRHPDDDWIARRLQGYSHDERKRVETLLDAAFPPKRSGGRQ